MTEGMQIVKLPSGKIMLNIEYAARNKLIWEQNASNWYKLAKKYAARRARPDFVRVAQAFKSAREQVRHWDARCDEMRAELLLK